MSTSDSQTPPAAEERAPEAGAPEDARIPAHGVAAEELLARMNARRGEDADWRHGRVFSLVYHLGDEHEELLEQASSLYFSSNYLNPLAFRSLKRMEAEVVRMSADLLGGDGEVVGTMTSGGTESILMAVKTYRDRARKRRPWIRHPEIVAPSTVHAAFRKACHYFGIKLVTVEPGDDYRADVAAMARRIGRNTILLCASAPQYPQGVVDPIEELGALAQEKKLPLHIDACIGGFLLPWVERLGRPVPRWDFRVPGVTSISADLHKYAYAAKGASVVLYRDMSYLQHQFFVATDWSGGIYASPTMAGTRPGGAIAAAWAALHALGEDGYLDSARQIMEATDRFVAGIHTIDGLQIFGAPHMSLVCFGARDPELDIFAVADALERRGWHIDRQQSPNSIHVTLMPQHLEVLERYLSDIAEAVDEVRADPSLRTQGQAAMYGMMAKMPFARITRRGVVELMKQMYAARGSGVPDLAAPGGDDKLLGWLTQRGPQVLELVDGVRAAASKLGEKFGRR
ncbi:pyridoxal phosphate-dependent decarboxylase family protein [Haliangium ochraceum]|uniref:Pyridoxal-dependent decarboxylase n=1 Tax=Haliangium ochraceum (strain DSM 14365 / JCM 11303 / SMP-2) TaxID=502025 RepID=D0LGQ4_HALO1|nr:aspartate aminotransferase family protein [Haliangium ochraceum]ACY12800.1 Pyridoxal-dependent decarboxylase [Haliangium ochraceum DSM 14365]